MTENERAPGGEFVPGEPDSAILEEHFKSTEVAGHYFEEIERALIAGRWQEVSRFRP